MVVVLAGDADLDYRFRRQGKLYMTLSAVDFDTYMYACLLWPVGMSGRGYQLHL